MLPSVYLDLPEQEATKEFASARNRALLRRIGAFLRRHPSSNRLLSFDEAAQKLTPWRQAYLGRRTVRVESIVGSEGRYADFDDEFLPLRGSSEERWRSVNAALRRGEGLPPVSLLEVDDAYFVRDGNHRCPWRVAWVSRRSTQKWLSCAPRSRSNPRSPPVTFRRGRAVRTCVHP